MTNFNAFEHEMSWACTYKGDMYLTSAAVSRKIVRCWTQLFATSYYWLISVHYLEINFKTTIGHRSAFNS